MNESRLVDTRQILYFVTCVKAGSFSKAAQILHSTQPSVSKMIKSMEDMLEIKLFERYAKGIVLTPEGENVYRHAEAVLENLKKIQILNEEAPEEEKRLLISCNPSSWFADMFMKFYEEKTEENISYTVYSAQTSEVINRVRERVDELGFVYIMAGEQAAFSYFAEKNYLDLELLARTDVMLYPGKKYKSRSLKSGTMDLSRAKLVRRFEDEFSADNYWDIRDSKGNSAAEMKAVVTTNSDYIMERLLKNSDLVNISARYLTPEQGAKERGVILSADESGKIWFGCVRRKGEVLSECAGEFLDFLKEKIKMEDVSGLQ